MNKLLKQTLVCAGALLLSMQAAAKPSSEAKEVRGIIDKVNTYWQTHNKPEVRSFWDNAAYHTGNMEAYFLTGNENYRAYSEAWAMHNEWKGAKEKDKSKWKYSYGESDEYVLFGDYQVCFQTYIDLYNILPDNYKIARAREVMEYEMSTPNQDYWWWSDGLYMVMPVMTKLYKVTGNALYLDKLYEYITYSDGIMLDRETGLYYRDAKYVYPKHKTPSGKKDFWARGDGWVLAGLAKVLKDLPADYKHRSFFVDKYVKLAEAVAAIQQPEGYWTRSMMDPTHAPGPETSGTAFFTYGFLWGINNGYLDEAVYKPVVDKAWSYLTKTALQKNGKIGYVQPIGEKAIPGQVVDADSEANFGVGAFLLAACEYVRYLEAPKNQDRAYWCNLLYKMAAPVLSNMAEGNLKKNMLVEVSPNWDGRNKGVTYMETFGRLMAGVAPWLTLPDDDTEEGQMRKQLREWALKSYANAVDPANPTICCGEDTDRLWWMRPTWPKVFYVPTTSFGCLLMIQPRNVILKNLPSCAGWTRLTPTGCCFLLPSRVSWQRQERNVMNTVSIRLSARWRNGIRETAGMRTALLSPSTIIVAMSSIPCTWKRCKA